jgi:hypothetical protein
MGTDWAQLRKLAQVQHGLLTRSQCLTAGMTRDSLDWQVRSGRWVRPHDGVFLVRPGQQSWTTQAVAALLCVDSGGGAADAALCGRAAAHLWGLEQKPTAPIGLVVPNRRSVVAPFGATVRRSMRWDDLVDELAYPWRTTVPVTVLDVASQGSEADALAIVARAIQRGLTTTGELRQEIVARGGHRHSKLFRQAFVDVEDGAESGAELLYRTRVERAHGLPRSRAQLSSDQGRRRRHDFGYETYGLIVEVDGRLGHEQWSDRVRDGQRDRQLLTTSATTRVFWADVAVTPCSTAREIGAILRSRGWRGRPHSCRRADCALPGPSLCRI